MNTWHYLSTTKMTVAIQLNHQHTITTTPPILRRFQGQPAQNLAHWLKQQPGYQHHKI